MKTTIGVLAGMGPRSTSPFLELVLDQCQLQYGAKYDIDYPPIMIYSLPTPFYLDRPINHKEMKVTIIKGLQELELTGVDFIAMPCNSAHIYFDELKSEIDVPLLNIIDETIKKISGDKQKITIFATESTFDSELYQNGIINSNNEFMFKDNWQKKIHNLIQKIKEGKDRQDINSLWNELLRDTINTGVDVIIMACTDLSVLENTYEDKINVIDSSIALAESVVKEYLSRK